ncbi:hypothetical protein ACVGVM_12200 [Pseudonocardia bannensis]|uniref:Uncharacterized protein n=1 Tax=Pseudonocardia bannensis TaxID=630973 RepID=A0A848DF06_9PSEU|nr:hypothetical protein [Pseudonocardia bannensis]NMH91228.1 hypothetical protein [Pseudonocardia bannensis]
MAGHGLLHLLGVVLLWGLAEPGALRFADNVPPAGSPVGALAGAGWLAATALFVLAAGLLSVRRRSWRVVALLAVAASVPFLAQMASAAGVGLVVDAVVAVAAVTTWLLDGRRACR